MHAAIEQRDQADTETEPEQAVQVLEHEVVRPQPGVDNVGQRGDRARERNANLGTGPPRQVAELRHPNLQCRGYECKEIGDRVGRGSPLADVQEDHAVEVVVAHQADTERGQREEQREQAESNRRRALPGQPEEQRAD